jgi:biopolymer transport protein TolQ
MSMVFFSPLLASGIEFGWRQSTTVGLVICGVLLVMSCMSWAVMCMKLYLIRRARAVNAEFLHVFRHSAHPLAIFQSGERFDFAPFFHIYYAAARELAFHMVGVDLPDKTFATRLQGAGRILPTQMEAVQVAMERAVAEAALKFEQRLGVVAMALSGAPFIGLLGTVWGVMDSFASLAQTDGTASIQAMAPGVCAALLTTVVGLLVAIPSMFGYNLLINRIRDMVVRLDNFASELCSTFDRHYVDHRARPDELPSLGALGTPVQSSFTATPAARTMPPPTRHMVADD